MGADRRGRGVRRSPERRTPPARLAVAVAEPSGARGTVTVVRAAGDLYAAAVERLWPVLEAALRTRRPVVLDTSRVDSADDAGLSVLFLADELARALGTSFVIAAPPDALLKLLARAPAGARLRVTPALGNVAAPLASGAGCDGFGAPV